MTVDDVLIRILDSMGPVDLPGIVQRVNEEQKYLASLRNWRWYESSANITVIPAYVTGTVTLTLDSATVAGASTVWAAEHVGRKFMQTTSTGYFTVEAVGSATSLTLDRVWPHATVTLKTYKIFEDTYSLPSDYSSLQDIMDTVSGLPLKGVIKHQANREWAGRVNDGFNYNFPARAWQWEFVIWGKDSNNYPEIQLRDISANTRELEVFYWRKPTAVTLINGTVDVADYMDNALFYRVLKRYLPRMSKANEVDAMVWMQARGENTRDYNEALKEALRRDTKLSKSRVRNARTVL